MRRTRFHPARPHLPRPQLEWLARRNRRPAAKAAAAPIGPAERVLTTGHDFAGALVVATSAAVYFQDRGGPAGIWSRLGWEDVDVVRWHDRHQVLAFTGVHPGGLWRKELVLASRSTLVDVARERARRQPGSGKVIWIVVLNEAAGISNPAIRAEVEAAIAALHNKTGIPVAETGDLAWLSPAARWPVATPGGHATEATPVADRHSMPGPALLGLRI